MRPITIDFIDVYIELVSELLGVDAPEVLIEDFDGDRFSIVVYEGDKPTHIAISDPIDVRNERAAVRAYFHIGGTLREYANALRHEGYDPIDSYAFSLICMDAYLDYSPDSSFYPEGLYETVLERADILSDEVYAAALDLFFSGFADRVRRENG
ncbi:MAG: hypothetical protein K5840_06295 [Eubacterium sp.]|nr:hypothetical protein [Eubacterium sp.]